MLKTLALASLAVRDGGEWRESAIHPSGSLEVDRTKFQSFTGTVFDCSQERSGRITRTGRGSLEVGAAFDDWS